MKIYEFYDEIIEGDKSNYFLYHWHIALCGADHYSMNNPEKLAIISTKNNISIEAISVSYHFQSLIRKEG